MFTRAFLVAVAERAFKSGCQAAAAVILQDAVGPNLFDATFIRVAASFGTMAAFSALTSFGSSVVGDSPSPSLTPAAEVAAAAPVR